jgi:ribonuclease BN (tRNA processing enzyme)
MSMRQLPVLAIAIAAAAAPFAIAQPQAGSAVATAPGKASVAQTVKATATIESVDKATRTVKLKMPNGATRDIVAGPEERNFDQLKAGDKVNVQYVEALTLELKKEGKAVVGRTESSGMTSAAKGEKPGAVAMREVVAVVDVVNVDTEKKIVSTKNKDGKIIELNVKDPEQLKLIKKGDQVQATYTEAVAISVEPMAAAKK